MVYNFDKTGKSLGVVDDKKASIVRVYDRAATEAHPLLELTEERTRNIAATVYSESYHDPKESEGIARVLRNRAYARMNRLGNTTNVSALLGAKSLFAWIGGSAMYGRNDDNYKRALGIEPIDKWSGTMRSDLEATIRGLVAETDISGGAFFWDGTAKLERKSHRWRNPDEKGHILVGGKDTHYVAKWGDTGKFEPGFLWIKDLGDPNMPSQTSFFRYNPDGPYSAQAGKGYP